MPDLTYRYADPADVPAVVALVESAYRGEESLAGWTSEAGLIGGQRTDAALVSALIAEPRAHVLLAEEAGVLLACCELRQPSAPGGSGYFGMFAVRPSGGDSAVGRVHIALESWHSCDHWVAWERRKRSQEQGRTHGR